ncbi:nucleotidyltransferase domain-containing protein [Lyngbya confervoides]|uniref:Nucleotidyltransferase family protein n=1 Tax=Lyngbya confervoides BDU141951 TaxID=1574623 RepID=A0ABD4T5U0_9CYAN|nr:nucleotidyltransferase family protein [Lyngbya confervoides]MCM1984141.1 nucleotidyltransferase family protein [Lyngbya confervoides BDU141951]
MNAFPITVPELTLLIALCRADLSPAQVQQITPLVEGNLDWDFLVTIAKTRKLVPLILENLRRYFKAQIPPPLLDSLHDSLQRSMRSNLLLTQSMVELVQYMQRQGLQMVPFKGPILAQVAYSNPTRRYFADLDFLVLETDFAAVSAHLTRIGMVANYLNDPSYYRQSQFAAPQTRLVIDLHYALTPAACFIEVPTPDLLDSLQPVGILGQSILTLSPECHLLALCVDAAKDYWRSLVRLMDIAQLVGQPSLEWPRVLAHAQAWGCQRTLLQSLYLAHRLLDASFPQSVQALIASGITYEVDDDTLVKQVLELKVDLKASLRWHRFNMQALESFSNCARYLYRIGKFTARDRLALNQRIRT